MQQSRGVVATFAWCLAAVLVYAAVDKVFHYRLFIKSLGDYPFISDNVARVIASPVILIEFSVGGALTMAAVRRSAAIISAILFALFGAIYVVAAMTDMNITCGCWFMLPAPPSPALHAALNATLTAMSLGVAGAAPNPHPLTRAAMSAS